MQSAPLHSKTLTASLIPMEASEKSKRFAIKNVKHSNAEPTACHYTATFYQYDRGK